MYPRIVPDVSHIFRWSREIGSISQQRCSISVIILKGEERISKLFIVGIAHCQETVLDVLEGVVSRLLGPLYETHSKSDRLRRRVDIRNETQHESDEFQCRLARNEAVSWEMADILT